MAFFTAPDHNHINSICSTWGKDHFKTFDGDVYQYPGMCEYNLASDCHESFLEFSVHMKRAPVDGHPTVSRVVVTIKDLIITLTKNLVTVNGEKVVMPYYGSGVFLERNPTYTRLSAKLGLTVMWNEEDAIMVELESKYANRTCGLCGDFNGIPVYDEFVQGGDNTSVERCAQLFHSDSWSSCAATLNPEPYIQACAQDMCSCGDNLDDFCLCSTLAEYSRQCSHAGGAPPNWRTPSFCVKTCPYNMVYSESGSPCLNTCTHRDTSSRCEEHTMDGCFCPEGTVLDDISERGCIPQDQCQCFHGRAYDSGEVLRLEREECACHHGMWSCESLSIPGMCAIEEGSHITTYDGKAYTFHGDCYYVFSKDCDSSKFTVLGRLVPCGIQETDTCLKSVVVLLNNDKSNALVFKSDGKVSHNAEISLPYSTADLTVFRPSSFHILMQTNFGLQLQVQLVPVMQLYVTTDQAYQGKMCGLCGNFNMALHDDLKTPQGLVEGTASSFANSWKAQGSCPDKTDRLDDPCSLSMENENYAEHWCSLLRNKDSKFAACHAMVDPESYYKRCKYSSCNCERSQDCLCAVFSSYVRACTAKNITLQDWRTNICDTYTESCPASQTFSDYLQGCQRTCRSLSSERQSCSTDFLPVDGCSCPEGLYQDHTGHCVQMAKCPCYHNGEHVKPGKSINIKDEHCVCTNGRLHCHSWKPGVGACPEPKVFFNCSTASPAEMGLACARSCRNLGLECFSDECESGCLCPSGFLNDGNGQCVREEDCPCSHDGKIYASGTSLSSKCNLCICKRGKWDCTENKCPATCTIYGSGHHSTFDEMNFGFRGQCGYVAVQDKCGNKTGKGSFGIITENIPCGTTGTTCSKSVRIFLGRTEVKLAEGTYEEIALKEGPVVEYKIRTAGLYLVVESSVGLTVLWDRKTTVRIILQPEHMGEVCGLCGDYDGDGVNDFKTQSLLPVSSQLEFANSWKVSSTCPDAGADLEPCSLKPHRHNWAKLQCSIIKGETFKECHAKVDPQPYYDNCVTDSCACDTGGDCECFCTAVAFYAQACNEAGVCVAWRTPDICPVFCDYYNKPEECKWHYSPCHKPCYKTCYNPDGICTNPIPNLEAICKNGSVEHKPPTPSTTTTTEPPIPSTTTTTTEPPTPPTTTTTAPPTPSTTTITTTTTTTEPPTPSSTTTTTPFPTTQCIPECEWSDWYDEDKPSSKKGDWETYENITASGKHICVNPEDIDCRSTDEPNMSLEEFVSITGQKVHCNVSFGLICKKEEQTERPYKCLNYKIKPPTPSNTTTTTPTTTTESPTPSTTTTTEPSTPSTTTTTTTTTTKPPSTTTTTEPPTPSTTTTTTTTESPAPSTTTTTTTPTTTTEPPTPSTTTTTTTTELPTPSTTTTTTTTTTTEPPTPSTTTTTEPPTPSTTTTTTPTTTT
uniref:VWFD domain-containing protein n=1 Tax=Scleropages formosus TaxID=113540 RepID=A0A8C9SGR7_SCLFO